MIDLAEIVPPERVILDLEVRGKAELLAALAGLAAGATGEPEDAVRAALDHREALGTTAVGGGIALPHARLAGLPVLTGFLVRLATPIECEAVDAEPVDLVVLLLAPEHAAHDYLRVLARVARVLADPERRRRLRRAGDVAAAHTALVGRGEPGAAASAA
jgi:PTS system nitrogen regulatory IIA component